MQIIKQETKYAILKPYYVFLDYFFKIAIRILSTKSDSMKIKMLMCKILLGYCYSLISNM